MKNQFQRLLDLARTTGDRLIVTDSEGEKAFVIMDIDQYESFVEDLDIIHSEDWMEEDFDDQDIINEQTEDEVDDNSVKSKENQTIWDTMHPAGDNQETWDLDGLSEEEMSDLERQFQEFVEKNGRNTEKNNHAEVEEEAIKTTEDSLVVSDEEPDEEQFYLEPIE